MMRVIQKALLDPLAELLLAGSVKYGENLTVSADSDGLILGDRANGATQNAMATVH